MGLDMYLYKKTFLSTGDFIKEEFREEIALTKGGKPHPRIKTEKIKYVIEEVGYWRKANHIHKWFVDNVQKGIDDCGEYNVSEDQILRLLYTCKSVLEDYEQTGGTKAHELLPTGNGFFFGSTEYDKYYFQDVKNTLEIVKDLFELDEEGQMYLDSDIYYSSSW